MIGDALSPCNKPSLYDTGIDSPPPPPPAYRFSYIRPPLPPCATTYTHTHIYRLWCERTCRSGSLASCRRRGRSDELATLACGRRHGARMLRCGSTTMLQQVHGGGGGGANGCRCRAAGLAVCLIDAFCFSQRYV